MFLDCIIIHPNASKKIYQDLSKDYSAIEPPIWAGMIANHLRKDGLSVDVLDCEALGLSDDEAVEYIKNQKVKLALFVVYGQQPSASTQNMTGATSLARELKWQIEDMEIAFVGPHVSALPQETLDKHPYIDHAFSNEGVYMIKDLIRTGEYKDRGVIQDLDEELPGVAWDLLPMSSYRTSFWHSLTNSCQRQPFASLYTSLGCPYNCSFCMINVIQPTNKFRHWSPECIIKEFSYFHANDIKNVKIADEMFVLKPRHFMKICELIISRGYDFNIWAYARVDTVKEEYLDTLKAAGVNWLALGIESANMNVRQEVTKGKFVDIDIRDIVGKIRAKGICVIANYIFGLPKDTEESMKETLTLAQELNTEEANFYSAMAYPGSQLHKNADPKDLPETYDGYSQHSFNTKPLRNENLSPAQIVGFRDHAWHTYHTSNKYLNMIEDKFGEEARNKMFDMTKIQLKRKLL